MYRLQLNRREKQELAYGKWFLVGLACLGMALVVWLAWIRPARTIASIDSFAKCQAAGHPIQESYPEVCLAPNGKRFVNPAQDQAHQASLQGGQEPIAPTDPALLYLDIEEWNVRVPLTDKTFDLGYTYVEDGATERVTFTFKRLVNAGLCRGDVGLSLTRSAAQHQPPFTPANPEPIAQAGNYYFYPAYAGAPCYDSNNSTQTTLVKQIAGDQSLTQVTAALLSKLEFAGQ